MDRVRKSALAPLEPLQAPGQAAVTERSADRRRQPGTAMSCLDAVEVALDSGKSAFEGDSSVTAGMGRTRLKQPRAAAQVRTPRQQRQAEPRVDGAPSVDGKIY